MLTNNKKDVTVKVNDIMDLCQVFRHDFLKDVI